MNKLNWNNKIALITGVTGGIGGILVRELIKNGVFCILVDQHENPNPEISDWIDNRKADYFQVDLTDAEKIIKFKEKLAKYERIDFEYNVAGLGIYKNIEDLDLDEWNDSLAVNLSAPFLITKISLDLLNNSDTPLVFNIGSGMGVIPSGGRIAYCSSKFGLRGLTLSLAREFSDKKIKFQLLTLGSVMTNFGTGGIAQRKELQDHGKKYLTPEFVVQKILDLTLDRESETEVELYPEGYGGKKV